MSMVVYGQVIKGYLLHLRKVQMAIMTAAIANGGTVLRPRLVLSPEEYRTMVTDKVNWTPESLRAVKQGMYDAVNADYGTAKFARIEACTLAGKTGTAEYYDKGERRKHAWMIAFGPFESPRYAIAVIVENSNSGGRAAAPIVHRVCSALFGSPSSPDIVPTPQGQPLPARMRGIVPEGLLDDDGDAAMAGDEEG